MKHNVLIILSISLLLCFSVPSLAEAHPGRTDASGGHTCRTNCESWGLGYGEYHYHGGYEAPVYEEQYVAPEQEEYIAPTEEIITEQIIEETEEEPVTESVKINTKPSVESVNSSNDSGNGLLGLAVLGGLGYLGWKKLKGKKKESNPET